MDRCSLATLSLAFTFVYQDPSSGQAAVVVPVAAGTVTAPVAAVCTP